MRIVNLMENTQGSCDIIAEHGLCVYIETEKHHLLVDTGASEKTWQNADTLGIDLNQIDTVLLSHGHYDHSGGILTFAKKNTHAKLYMTRKASGEYYSMKKGPAYYIGIDKNILNLANVILVDGDETIDDEISLFGHVTGRRKWPSSNLILKEKRGEEYVQDSFDHEQYVVISAEDKHILISGCAHNGILNILDRYKEIYDTAPDMVISGFHMMKKYDYTEEEIQLIKDIAEELKSDYPETTFYTGHCTGLPAFEIMKEIMGDQLVYMHSGDTIEE